MFSKKKAYKPSILIRVLALATALMLLPAWAFAATPSSISLNSTVAANSTVAYNTAVTFTGKVDPDHQTTVSIQLKKLGANKFETIGQVSTDAQGNYTYAFNTSYSGYYQVTWPGDTDHDAATSTNILINSQAQITLGAAPKPSWAGEEFNVSGTLTPAHKNASVSIQENGGGKWSTIARGKTGKDSKFKIKLSISKKGARRLRAAFSDTDHALTTSSGFNINLKWANPWKLSASYPEYVVVSKRTFKLWLLRHGRIFKTFRVGVGMPAYPTPSGNFEVTRKAVRPTWNNPQSDWSKDMPDSIPWPSSPLGERGLYLSAPGIIIHGTTQPWLLDRPYRAVSHGCIRLKNPWVIWLYNRVPVGTPVKIYG